MSDQHVRIGQLATARGAGRLLAIGLGSCVAIILYDRARRIGGLAHVLLPDPSAARDDSNPARFATRAVPALLEEMRALGASAPFEARLVGGAALFGNMLASAQGQMGDRNVGAASAAIAALMIPVLASDTGGSAGRSVTFDIATGEVAVRGVRGGHRVL
jgi:chemotaxis protein CheD